MKNFPPKQEGKDKGWSIYIKYVHWYVGYPKHASIACSLHKNHECIHACIYLILVLCISNIISVYII